MNIGIDVDGVLVDMEAYQLKYGKKYFEKYNKTIANPRGYDVKDIFNCTKKEREKFWTKYIWKYCLREPMTNGAADCVRKLSEQGHKIIIITGRAHTTEKGITGKLFRCMLRYWLKKNNFIYDEIYYCSENGSAEDKSNICYEQKIDVLIDDKPENLLAVKDKINIICYPAVWNEKYIELDEYRVKDFKAIWERVAKLME